MKNPLTPAGIEPATFRFVAQHLNHCATAVQSTIGTTKKRMVGLCTYRYQQMQNERVEGEVKKIADWEKFVTEAKVRIGL